MCPKQGYVRLPVSKLCRKKLEASNTIITMGDLYHRKSPFDHMAELRGTSKSGGELVPNTLISEGGTEKVLVPEGHYAMMNNIRLQPSVPTLFSWLKKAGFRESVVSILTAPPPMNSAPRRALFMAQKSE